MIVRFDPQPEDLQCFRIGPLGPHINSFAALISHQGYCRKNGGLKIQLVADLSRWLERKHIKLQQLDERQIEDFLTVRWKSTANRSGDQATMKVLLRHLREAHVIPVPPPPTSDLDLITGDFERFLLKERGLIPASVKQYLPVARRFLAHRFGSEKPRVKLLGTKDVIDFVLQDATHRGRRSAQLMTTVLRSFLSFLFQEGRIASNLAAVVPAMPGWRLSELPRYLEAAQVEMVLRGCDRRKKVGKRDHAILLLLARLGLRAGEVAGLNLDDIDWNTGELNIRGKGGRVDRLPLVQDVGKAIADYLHTARPRCSSRRVFIQCQAPYVGFASPPTGICSIVRSALKRAHLCPRHHGAHLLRHSLATRMIGSGASLAQIGQVLRHQHIQTTEIYAKVDLNALRALAQPWPGGAR